MADKINSTLELLKECRRNCEQMASSTSTNAKNDFHRATEYLSQCENLLRENASKANQYSYYPPSPRYPEEMFP